jgi:UrcA family protein
MKTSSALFAAALGTATLFASPAAAAPAETGQVEVRYRDLDLSTDAGAKELDRRLHQAAEQVCGMNAPTTGTRMPSNNARKCYKETLAQLQDRFAQVVTAGKARG